MKVYEREYSEYDIDMDLWRAAKPHGISGCFRLRNEAQFMRQAVESFLPWLDEAVLVVQPSDDETVELAHQMAAEYDKVIVYEYPVIPYPINTPEHFSEPTNSIRHFVHLSNWALSKCKYSWICKVEGDVIALQSFDDIRKLVDAFPHQHTYYGMVILNVAGKDGKQFSATNPRNHGWDEAVFNNDGSWYFVRNDKWETIQHWEHPQDNICMGWTLMHLKRCKDKFLPVWNNEVYLPITQDNLTAALRNYDRRNPYQGLDNPFGEPILLEWEL